jgi:two-component system, NarL family, sensor kinase
MTSSVVARTGIRMIPRSRSDRDLKSRDTPADVGHPRLVQPVARGIGASAATRTPYSIRLLPVAVLGLLVVLVGFFAAAVALTGADALDGLVDRFYLFSAVVVVSCGALAYVVWRHDQRNRIATIALAIAWAFTTSLVLERYTLLGVDRGWPGTEWTLWISQWIWVPALLSVPTLLALRFPDGRLPSSAWRPWEIGVLVLLAVVAVGFALTPYGELDTEPRVDLPHPLVAEQAQAVFVAAMIGTGAGAVGCVMAFVIRMRRSRGVERIQLQWGVAGLVGAAGLVGISVALGEGAAWLALVGITLLPAAIGVAVLRHGLFDVGRVLNRSLVYGSLTVSILAVYAVAVGLLGDVLGRTVGAPLVATGVVALGVEPLRRRLQRVANRVVYGHRDDPYEVLVRLGAQLTTPADRALDGVTAAVTEALRLRGAAIIVAGRTVAGIGDGTAPWTDVPLAAQEVSPGVLRVSTQPGQRLSARDRRLLADLSHQVSAAVAAAHLRGEVEASRARLIVAREEERRRIRHDLHDGLGPTLAAIGLEIERAGLDVASDPAGASARLEDAVSRVRETVRGVRSLVEGLRPASLDEFGLDGAVRELARTLDTGPVTIDVASSGDLGELPAAVSLAAYRIVSEALTNVVRHAGASSCRIELERTPKELRVSVGDDGAGIPGTPRSGVGIGSMRSRAAEIGGTLTLTSDPGEGTTVRAELPVEAP